MANSISMAPPTNDDDDDDDDDDGGGGGGGGGVVIAPTLSSCSFGGCLLSCLSDILSTGIVDEVGFVQIDPPAIAITALADTHDVAALAVVDHVFILSEDGCKLGLPYWILPILFSYVHPRLMSILPSLRCGYESIMNVASTALCLTRVLLLLNGDCYSAWNARKRILSIAINANMLTVDDELAFISLVFTKHPKSGEAWSHRQWVMDRYCINIRYDERNIDDRQRCKEKVKDYRTVTTNINDDVGKIRMRLEAFQREVNVCERAAEIYPKNYFAWTYRGWILDQFCYVDSDEHILEQEIVNMNSGDSPRTAVLRKELQRVSSWNELHISDYSGFFHRQRVLRLLADRPEFSVLRKDHTTCIRTAADPSIDENLQCDLHYAIERNAVANMWLCEISWLHDILTKFIGHEALWAHRRFLFNRWIEFMKQNEGIKSMTCMNSINCNVSIPCMESELIYVMGILNNDEVTTSKQREHRHFAQLYRDWLIRTVK